MADIRMRFLGHQWERTTIAAEAGEHEELFIALFLRAMETVPELRALPGDLEAYDVRWDGEEVSIYHPDVKQAIFRALVEPERSAQGALQRGRGRPSCGARSAATASTRLRRSWPRSRVCGQRSWNRMSTGWSASGTSPPGASGTSWRSTTRPARLTDGRAWG